MAVTLGSPPSGARVRACARREVEGSVRMIPLPRAVAPPIMGRRRSPIAVKGVEMSSRNAITWLDAHDAFNRRDLDSVVAAFSPDCVYTDQARGITLKSPAEFQDWLGEWIRGFSDAETAEHAVFHAGDTVVCEFITRGTNNGPLGPLPPTGR